MMLSDKEMKTKFKAIAQKEPEKYYPVQALKELGFEQKQCKKCFTFYWTTTNREICDDPQCSGSFRFIEKTPAKNKLSYIEAWKEFSKMFKKFDYTPIKRFPSVARWNTSIPFTIASIAAFQPFVVSGEVKPPANPLVIPQFCLRFGDIDSTGLSQHMVGFVMIGQHAFVPPKEYDTNRYLKEIYTWLHKGLGLPKNEMTFHQDAWAGNKNYGSSLEFFSRGLEIGNQVYMQYEQTSAGSRELPIKVLDMGMGQERCAWFTQGKSTIYDSTFPPVCKKLYEIAGIKPNTELQKRFLPFAPNLNLDEVGDINKAWKKVAQAMKVDVQELKAEIQPLAAVYSIAEHARALLVAISDSALPSNMGGGYNLRVLFRRAQSFIEQYQWKLSMQEIAAWHAAYLKPLFPELSESLDIVQRVLDVEKIKFDNTRQKTASIVAKLQEKEINQNKLLELYDSQGIAPELIQQEFKKQGKEVNIPENFYALIADRHEKQVQEHQTQHNEEEIKLGDIAETQALYYGDWKASAFTAKVVKGDGPKVVLDKTFFYPTSGGQLHDLGTINKIPVVNVYKQGPHIVHVLEVAAKLKPGDQVQGEVNPERRKQLAQHHTSTHIVNAAARIVLGKHANQAGAKKTEEKAHIDITHYQSISEEELLEIEKVANDIIRKQVPIEKTFMDRTEAEQKYGFTIYQGGVPPGKKLRIVNILGYDVEACGGTHLNNTSEAELIKVLKASKIQDGVVRIEFTAGAAALREMNKESRMIEEAAQLLQGTKDQGPARCKELFELWRNRKKEKETRGHLQFEMDMTTVDGKKIAEKVLGTERKPKIILTTTEKENLPDKELMERAAQILKTQPEHVVNTIKRFLKDLQ
ncbi:MAG: alanine--tRNA ligase [Nanoarchaeota archaeon]